jgi:hypothetical protein
MINDFHSKSIFHKRNLTNWNALRQARKKIITYLDKWFKGKSLWCQVAPSHEKPFRAWWPKYESNPTHMHEVDLLPSAGSTHKFAAAQGYARLSSTLHRVNILSQCQAVHG